MKVPLLRRHRHICEMRRLQAATFLSLPVGLSVGLETPAGCWASPIPPQLHLLGQCRPPGHEGEQPLGQGGPWLDPDPSCNARNWRNLWLWRTWCCLWLVGSAHGADCGVVTPDSQGRFQPGFTQLIPPLHGPERGLERGAAELGAGPLLRSLHSLFILLVFFFHFLVLLGRSSSLSLSQALCSPLFRLLWI